MSDDTATVDVVQRLREYHAGETQYIATLADAVDEIEDNRTLIEQQARTIAELTKTDEVHWKTRRGLLAKIAEQAARLEAMERQREKAIWRLVKLPCACPYDPGKEGEGAQLMGPICDRCAAIHLLNGGDLPDSAIDGAKT